MLDMGDVFKEYKLKGWEVFNYINKKKEIGLLFPLRNLKKPWCNGKEEPEPAFLFRCLFLEFS